MSTDLHTLSGVYAIDALSPHEAAEFRKHLELCPSCQQEVRELREAASRMGASEAQAPSPHLKSRVMAAADRTPQLPPKVRDIRSGGRWSPKWSPRLLAAAVAVVILVVAAGVAGISQMQGRNDQPVMAASVSQVFHASDAHTATVDTAQGKVVIATSRTLGKMALETDGLSKLGQKRVYQLWTIKGDQTTSAGLVDKVDEGAAMDLPGKGYRVAITIEPSGGSDQPTTQPIVTVDPRAV